MLTDLTKYLKDPYHYVKDEQLKIKNILRVFDVVGEELFAKLYKISFLLWNRDTREYGL